VKLSRHARPATPESSYLWGAAVVWAAIWIGTAVVLKGGGDFADMIPILAIGTGWFVAVVPWQLSNRSDQGGSDGD
jgi:hypothetical protein